MDRNAAIHPLPDGAHDRPHDERRTVTKMATKKTPWAVLLCRFKDTDAVNIPLGTVNKLFTTEGAGTFNSLRFFSDYSHGSLDLSGSQVFPQTPNYLTIDARLNDHVPPTEPAPPGWTRTITRDQLAVQVFQAATDASVPLKNFYGIIMIFNAAIGIAWGGGSPVGPAVGADFRWVTNNGMTIFGQEMGHGYGLQHSRRDGSTADYRDPWDVMSTAAFPWTIDRDPDFGLHGPGLNAANMRAQGWLDQERIWRGSPRGYCAVIELRPLHRRDLPGNLAAEFPGGRSSCIVEYRNRADWDSGIPRSAVFVHRFEGGRSYLMSGTNGNPDMVAGDSFDPYPSNPVIGGALRVEVLSIDDAKRTATVKLCYSRPKLPVDLHGIFSTVIGQLAADGGGLVWDGHRFVPVPPWNPMQEVLGPIATFITADDVGDPLLRDAVRRQALERIRVTIDEASRALDPIQVPASARPGRPVKADGDTAEGNDRTADSVSG